MKLKSSCKQAKSLTSLSLTFVVASILLLVCFSDNSGTDLVLLQQQIEIGTSTPQAYKFSCNEVE